MRPLLELDEPRKPCPSAPHTLVLRLVLLHGREVRRGRRLPASRHALVDELPEPQHVLAGHDFVTDAAKEEHRGLLGEERDFRRRVPLLVAEERERAEHGQRVGHEAREGEEGVLEDQRADLRAAFISVLEKMRF